MNTQLTGTPESVVAVGADHLADAFAAQAVPVTRVDWRPPMPGTQDDLACVAADPLRLDANERALAAVLDVQARLVDVGPVSCWGWAAATSCTRVRRSRGPTPPARCVAP